MPPSADDMTGSELEAFQAALLDAFPVKPRLEQLVKFEFDVSLASVADGDTLTIVVFRLIEWADANGRLEHLVAAAERAVPDNPKLRAFIADRGKRTPSREASGPAPGPHRAAPARASADAGGTTVRLLVIGTFCVTALFAVCIVFVMVLVGVLPAAQLWVAVVPVGLLAALAFRMAPRHGSLAAA